MEKIVVTNSRRMSGVWQGREEGKCTHLTIGGSTGFSVRTLVQVVAYLIVFPLYVTSAVDTARSTAIQVEMVLLPSHKFASLPCLYY